MSTKYKKLFYCFIAVTAIGVFQPIMAALDRNPIDVIPLAPIDDEGKPPVIIPLGEDSSSFTYYAMVYDDFSVELSFNQNIGTADAEIYNGDMVVSIWHKPSTSNTLSMNLPFAPGNYTIYVYLQNGQSFQGAYTVE